MTRTLIPLLLILTASACRNNPAREGEDVEANALVVVHPKVDRRIRYVKHSQRRTEDGRLSIRVVLSSRSARDRALIARTSWLDGNGDVVEQSTERSFLIPAGGTFVYEDTSFGACETFNVAVRKASTKRKR